MKKDRTLNKDRWMTFIDHLWSVVAYGQLINLYQKTPLPGSFFHLTALAVRNELLMRIAHTVHLCEVIADKHDVGPAASATLNEIKVLYERGYTDNKSALTFDDCGVKVFRDKVLGHPLNTIKTTLGKDEYQISLKWETVEETLSKLKLFATQVEMHYLDDWDFSTAKDEVIGVDDDFNHVISSLREAEDYDNLKFEISKRGSPRISWDWQKRAFVFED